MLLFDLLREPINALSHGAGMLLAVPVTWILWKRCRNVGRDARLDPRPQPANARYHEIKAICLLIFGATLILCYGSSAAFHGLPLDGESLYRLQRLDHVGIYLLIAGTYTPVAWALMRRTWTYGTLTTVWTAAIVCASGVWYGGVMPIWISTLIYLVLGWGALFCYFHLAQTYSHATLLPLPLGGVFYSVGAILNILHWPVLIPGVFAAHELFHFFVIAGSASHIHFMLKMVVPSLAAPSDAPRMPKPEPEASWRGRRSRWLVHFPAPRRRARALLASRVRIGAGQDHDLKSIPPDGAVEAV